MKIRRSREKEQSESRMKMEGNRERQRGRIGTKGGRELDRNQIADGDVSGLGYRGQDRHRNESSSKQARPEDGRKHGIKAETGKARAEGAKKLLAR